MSSPFRWEKEPAERQKYVEGLFFDGSSQYNGITSEPLGVWMPAEFRETAELVYNFEVRPDDVWVVTYPKCGTTWMQEMLWMIVNNLDFEKALTVSPMARIPFLEMQSIFNRKDKERMAGFMQDTEAGRSQFEAMTESIKFAANLPSPRVIKSHLPIEMLPPALLEKCKVVWVGRNPKDCCVSYYHFFQMLPPVKYKGNFEQFAELFKSGFIEYGSYWTHVRSAWKYRDHPNLKIVWYEEMKKDLISVIRDVSKFLGKHLTEYRILKLDDHLYIDNFRENFNKTNPGQGMEQFIRKGKVGGWKEYMTDEKLTEWNNWIAKNMEGIGFDIKFEL